MTDLVQSARGPLRNYLESRVKLDLSDMSLEGLWTMSEHGEQMEISALLMTGLANRELSTRIETRDLVRELKRRGKPPAKFYYSIGAVEAFEALPNFSAAEALALLGNTKVRHTLTWTPEEREAFVTGAPVRGITIEQAAELPTREFEKRTKAVDPVTAALQSKNARLETELKRLREEARKTRSLQALEDLPPFAREAREEAMVLAEQMMLAVERLEDVADRCLLADVDHPERLRWQPAAAATMVHATGGPIARATALLRRLQKRFPEATAGSLDGDAVLEPGEARLFIASRERIAARASEEFTARSDDRANSTPGKRGRKRGASA